MKLYLKKQLVNPYTICVIIILPILTFLFLSFDTGLLPKFWQKLYPGESAAGDDLWIFSHVRHMETFVDAMEWYVPYSRHLLPMLSSLAVIPFIQVRDHFLPFAYVRIKHPRKTECLWIIRAVFLSGSIVFCSYLLTMLVMRLLCINTYEEQVCFEVFINQWGIPLTGKQHPYFYTLALGILRCFLLPMLTALLTIAVSYLSNKIYIYLLVPTVYNFIACSVFSQGVYEDSWPLPLFSPENMMWPSSPDYWGYGHTIHGIWGVVGASFIIIIPSVFMIWYGMRKRRI